MERKYSKGASENVHEEMHEMKEGTLKSGRSGKKVTNPKQAIAIGLSEARKEGKKVPPAPAAKKSTTKKSATKKSATKKSTAATKKSSTKKSAIKKTVSKKAPAATRRTAAKKTATRKTATKED
jgi:hypothetical protein